MSWPFTFRQELNGKPFSSWMFFKSLSTINTILELESLEIDRGFKVDVDWDALRGGFAHHDVF
jgi:hypothetical protein